MASFVTGQSFDFNTGGARGLHSRPVSKVDWSPNQRSKVDQVDAMILLRWHQPVEQATIIPF